MERTIQIHNVPDDLYQTLKARAAMAGTSLSGYLIGELREIAGRPTLTEFRSRLRSRTRVTLSLDMADLLRRDRDTRS